ncbi:unnamed protein product [Cyclocybe aegerita]|uniref:Aminoglycoside phosphotransferase domain-containing protein n=1 Tax=Cyclocybe aegerita TaxID=1973307 RepID=A0A8S0W871_CYCAE|nr:unnamed protein product [Cyclocybe aegerita]
MYACAKQLGRKIIRGTVTDGHNWIFLVLKMNPNDDGAVYAQSLRRTRLMTVVPPGDEEISRTMSDVIAGIITYWLSVPEVNPLTHLAHPTFVDQAMSDLSVPHELNTDEHKAIVTHLKSLEESDCGEEGMRCFPLSLPGRPPLFIKHSYYDILAEANTQNFFYLLAKDDASAPRIPRVLDAFSSDEGDCFVVMEKIDAQTLGDCGIPEAEAVDLAAFAVKWLQDQLSSVPDTVFGRISFEEAPVWHQFFKDHQPPGVFANPKQLAEYVSEASQRCRPKERRLSINQVLALFGDDRQIYHCDIKKENFLLNSKGVWIIDFQHIGVLPQVFQTYAFFNIGEPFAAKVGRKLGYRPSRTANAMVPISGVLRQCGVIPIPKLTSRHTLQGKS